MGNKEEKFAEYLYEGERMLFFSENAELKFPSYVNASKPMGSHFTASRGGPLHHSFTTPFMITDRSFSYLSLGGGFWGNRTHRTDYIYDVNWAKEFIQKRIDEHKEKKSLTPTTNLQVYVAKSAEIEKSFMGSEHIAMEVYMVPVDSFLKRSINLLSKLKLGTRTFKVQVRLMKPFKGTEIAGAFLTTMMGGIGGGAILHHSHLEKDVDYEPIIDIMKAKAKEIAAYIEELDSMVS